MSERASVAGGLSGDSGIFYGPAEGVEVNLRVCMGKYYYLVTNNH